MRQSLRVHRRFRLLCVRGVKVRLVAASTGDNKAAELSSILQQAKKEHLGKKSSRKKWKQLAKNAFTSGSNRKENGLVLECQLGSGQSTLDNIDPHELTLLQLLALNALELTAPASNILLKNRSNNWFQLSGHEGSFAPAGPGTIWKKRSADDTEVKAYKELMDDTMADLVPKFYRDIEYQGEHFIEMQDLLYIFKNPAVMDIKMGTRTFLESEVTNCKSRPDLYQKMIKINPLAPTEEEHLSKSITKLRYMQFRENLSSSSSFGFRIEGFKAEGEAPTKDFALVSTEEDIVNTMQMFIGTHESVRLQLIERLKELRSQLEKSKFFRTHEVIGSSLLIIHDGNTSGIWMIDFAKSVPTQGVEMDHRSPWTLGNHEDGYLFGLDNLILILEACSTKEATDTRT